MLKRNFVHVLEKVGLSCGDMHDVYITSGEYNCVQSFVPDCTQIGETNVENMNSKFKYTAR
jgi:hypothetical protein